MRSKLSESDIDLIIELGRNLTGTKINKNQHSVIIQNIASRISDLDLADLESYLELVDNNPNEMPYLLSALTIHTTGWFREPAAFTQFNLSLKNTYQGYSQSNPYRLLSIACSTGEEVYSFAAILESYRVKSPGFEYSVEGWDIDPISLRTATNGIYEFKSVSRIPDEYLPSLGRSLNNDVRFEISPHIKDRCRFRTVNIATPHKVETCFDFIACRNMLIYFEENEVKKIVAFIRSILKQKGFFCTGVSETGAVQNMGFASIKSAVFEKNDSDAKDLARSVSRSFEAEVKPNEGMNILLLDDDEDILEVMKDTLTPLAYNITTSASPIDALSLVKEKTFSLILSDFNMPGMNGFNFLKAIRTTGYRGNFVLITSYADQNLTKQALNFGCDEVILKPYLGKELERLVKNYVKPSVSLKSRSIKKPDLILFGASTGGTEVLSSILSKFPGNSPPVLVVQHISPGFAKDFADRLARQSGLTLGGMKNFETLLPGHLYASFGDYHIGVRQVDQQLKLILSDDPPISGHRPSVDFLFCSAASTSVDILATLLTGMGKDGAYGLSLLYQKGAETIVQDEASCVVFGMPKEAIALGAARKICNPREIKTLLGAAINGDKTKKAS